LFGFCSGILHQFLFWRLPKLRNNREKTRKREIKAGKRQIGEFWQKSANLTKNRPKSDEFNKRYQTYNGGSQQSVRTPN